MPNFSMDPDSPYQRSRVEVLKESISRTQSAAELADIAASLRIPRADIQCSDMVYTILSMKDVPDRLEKAKWIVCHYEIPDGEVQDECYRLVKNLVQCEADFSESHAKETMLWVHQHALVRAGEYGGGARIVITHLLAHACRQGLLEMVQLFVGISNPHHPQLAIALREAVSRGYFDIADWLVTTYPEQSAFRDIGSITAFFHSLFRSGDKSIVEWTFQHGYTNMYNDFDNSYALLMLNSVCSCPSPAFVRWAVSRLGLDTKSILVIPNNIWCCNGQPETLEYIMDVYNIEMDVNCARFNEFDWSMICRDLNVDMAAWVLSHGWLDTLPNDWIICAAILHKHSKKDFERDAITFCDWVTQSSLAEKITRKSVLDVAARSCEEQCVEFTSYLTKTFDLTGHDIQEGLTHLYNTFGSRIPPFSRFVFEVCSDLTGDWKRQTALGLIRSGDFVNLEWLIDRYDMTATEWKFLVKKGLRVALCSGHLHILQYLVEKLEPSPEYCEKALERCDEIYLLSDIRDFMESFLEILPAKSAKKLT